MTDIERIRKSLSTPLIPIESLPDAAYDYKKALELALPWVKAMCEHDNEGCDAIYKQYDGKCTCGADEAQRAISQIANLLDPPK